MKYLETRSSLDALLQKKSIGTDKVIFSSETICCIARDILRQQTLVWPKVHSICASLVHPHGLVSPELRDPSRSKPGSGSQKFIL